MPSRSLPVAIPIPRLEELRLLRELGALDHREQAALEPAERSRDDDHLPSRRSSPSSMLAPVVDCPFASRKKRSTPKRRIHSRVEPTVRRLEIGKLLLDRFRGSADLVFRPTIRTRWCAGERRRDPATEPLPLRPFPAPPALRSRTSRCRLRRARLRGAPAVTGESCAPASVKGNLRRPRRDRCVRACYPAGNPRSSPIA